MNTHPWGSATVTSYAPGVHLFQGESMKRLSEAERREIEHEEDEWWWLYEERKRKEKEAEEEAMWNEWDELERMERMED